MVRVRASLNKPKECVDWVVLRLASLVDGVGREVHIARVRLDAGGRLTDLRVFVRDADTWMVLGAYQGDARARRRELSSTEAGEGYYCQEAGDGHHVVCIRGQGPAGAAMKVVWQVKCGWNWTSGCEFV